MSVRFSRFTLRRITLLFTVSMLALSACQPTPQIAEVVPTNTVLASVTLAPTHAPTVSPTVEITQTSTPEPSPTVQPPMVVVQDQGFIEDTVTIAQVFSQGPGWLVIHVDNQGNPGSVLGYAPVEDGLNENVIVNIDESDSTPILYAMLHTDAGVVGVYEFPGDDVPIMVNGQMVSPAFTVQSGGQGNTVLDDSVTITIGDSFFSPENITVKVGTKVKWENSGAYAHTVTSDNGTFKSSRLQSGDKFEYTFKTAGSYAYFCTIHGAKDGQGMSGVIVVEP